jgi:hypothetical protein
VKLPASDHPEETVVYGAEVCPVLTEEFLIQRAGTEDVLDSALTIYSAVAKAEALYAEKGEPLSIVHLTERLVARVGDA